MAARSKSGVGASKSGKVVERVDGYDRTVHGKKQHVGPHKQRYARKGRRARVAEPKVSRTARLETCEKMCAHLHERVKHLELPWYKRTFTKAPPR